MTTPWDDIKIAFSIVDVGKFDIWMDFNGKGEKLLPDRWAYLETYSSPVSAFAIFTVDKAPTNEDGEKIRKLLKQFQ